MEYISYKKTNSWFSIIEKSEKKKENLADSEIKRLYLQQAYNINKCKDNKIIRSHKYTLKFNNDEIIKLNEIFNIRMEMYNETITYLRQIINKHNYKTKEVEDLLNFKNLRTKHLFKIKQNIINNSIFKDKGGLVHSLDLTIKTACAMFKSALSNYDNYLKDRIKLIEKLNKNNEKVELEPIKFPYMKLKSKNKLIKVLEIPRDSYCNNEEDSGFFISILNNNKINVINNDKLFLLNQKNIKSDTILQYNSIKNKYYLFIPIEKRTKYILNRDEKIGIDLGIRTFATIYSGDEGNKKIIEIASNDEITKMLNKHYNIIDDINKKINNNNKKIYKIKQNNNNNNNNNNNYNFKKEKKRIKKQKLKKKILKENEKIRNKIKDLHYKTANYLNRRYGIIYLGDIKTKSIINKENKDAKDREKNKELNRKMNSVSFYKFKQIMKNKCEEYNVNFKLINEFRTSQTCSNCLSINKNIKDSKIYNCINNKCKYYINNIDRDVNAAINMYNNINKY